jgi:hypothetical protein
MTGLLCGLGVAGFFGSGPAIAQGEITLRPVRFEALVPVEATGGSVPKTAAQLKFHFEVSGQIAGSVARGTWIAENVGEVAPPNYQIDSAELSLQGSPVNGSFSLSQPDQGWPIGQYRLEISVGGNIVHTERFSIQ